MKFSPHPIGVPKGLTIIELTVVILILLGLVSILFFGSQAYLQGANRAKCIVNLRDAHQAGRSYQNLNGLQPGDPYDASSFVGFDNFLVAEPVCPSGGDYTWAAAVPDFGELFIRCSLEGSEQHIPNNFSDW